MESNIMAQRRRRRRQSHNTNLSQQMPQYEWAFDAAGRPLHISQAIRSETYTCPICGGKMVARLGDIKQHHFAHDSLGPCTPANVTCAVAKRWLVLNLGRCLERRRMVTISWPCPICKQTHAANLLDDIQHIQQDVAQYDIVSDVALLDASGRIRAVIAVTPPDPDMLAVYLRKGITVLFVNPDHLRGERLTLEFLLSGATIYGGPCTTQETFAQEGVITDIESLRRVLVETANRPPYRFYGPLESHDELTHILTLGQQKLWLPPLLWRRAVGGMLHSIAPRLQVVSQEWPQDDGRVVALYYVSLKDTYAIAVRRFESSDAVYARLGSAIFRTPRVTALDIARSFAER
jgi:hypothetical protein